MQQYGPGLGYLATVRADGGPRVHPVSPVITDEGLFCFVVDSPKRRDLERDGRYALHSFPPEDSDDEAYVAGRAAPGHRPGARGRRSPATCGRRRRSTGGCSSSSVDVAMLARHGSSGATPLPRIPRAVGPRCRCGSIRRRACDRARGAVPDHAAAPAPRGEPAPER